MNIRLVILLLCWAHLLDGQSDFWQSQWVGQLSLAGESHFIRIQSKANKVTLQLPYSDGSRRYSIENKSLENELPSFSIRRRVNQLEFELTLGEGDYVEGTVERKGLVGSFYLHRVLPMQSPQWQGYLGHDVLANGLVFKI
ncbi:MAG: hypothetical protein HRU41_33980 [Saprospiraceae bacterium]|nr:hypothetical protein [Saprospiraceae bacterium]